jgi:hypothetical protein
MTDYERTTTCPYCGKVNTGLGNLHDEGRPKDGNVALCIDCGQWAVIEGAAPGGLRKPTTEEQHELAESPEAQDMNHRWRRMKDIVARQGGPSQ